MSVSPFTTFASLQEKLDRAAPSAGLSAIPASDGGVDGVGNLTLAGQGAALGTPVSKSTKMFSPVVLRQKNSVCLSYIGMGATFCLKTSCSTASHQDPSGCFSFEGDIIVIKKNEVVAFSAPSAPFKRMDPALLEHWTANPKSLDEWGEAFLAYKRCLEALPLESEDVVTTDMLSAKKRFQRQMMQARTPARNLFPGEPKEEEFVDVTGFDTPSPFKPSASTLTLPTKATDSEKGLARLIRRVETGLEATTNNLIQNRSIIKDQDKILRGLESRLDTVQDQVGQIPLGLSAEFVAPTLNGQVALIAEKVITALKPSGTGTPVSQAQVTTWVNAWWSKMPTQAQVDDAQVFCKDCEKFLTSLVISFQKQSADVAALAAKVQTLTIGLANSSAPQQPPGPSLFASLSQSLGSGVPTATLGSATQGQGSGAMASSSAAAVQAAQASTIASLEQRMKLLDAKLGQLSSHSASTTVNFGGAGFSSPRDVIPLIQAEMSATPYFGCFVNAAILFEWIQGNLSVTTLSKIWKLCGN
jgi:hypothetical protein